MLGKTRRPELRALLDDYVKRVNRYAPTEISEVRDDGAALKKLDALRPGVVVLLDAEGKAMNSEVFAKWIGEQRDRSPGHLVFLCGDADGFPEALRQRAQQKVSLGTMTFSHELARVMLAEQLYRAFAILGGSPYPK